MQKTETEQVKHVYCDDCGRKIKDAWDYGHCVICGKELCRQGTFEQPSCVVYDNRDTGDYPTQYCRKCWGIGEPFREKEAEIKRQYEEVENEWDEKLEKVREEWISACNKSE